MKSKWFGIKEKACALRQKGLSIRMIERQLKIPRSTLSGWFKDIPLTGQQLKKLDRSWRMGLVKARKLAVKWHNTQKNLRLKEAKSWAKQKCSAINFQDILPLHLAFSMLYLGEGFKGEGGTGMGNSDPMILRFFVAMLKTHDVPLSKIKCELHLRADQNPNDMQAFWSKELKLPLSNFMSVNFDKRTVGSPTYPSYKGVCVVRCGNIAIQRKLMYFSRIFCEQVIAKYL